MPTYRYRCAKCGGELEEWQSFSDDPLVKHAACGGKLARVLSTPGIVLKGSGFYRTDSRNGSAKVDSAKDGSTTDDAAAASETTSTTSDADGATEGAAAGATSTDTEKKSDPKPSKTT